LRLREADVPLFYEPDAKALHHHAMTLEDSLKRMETLGRSAVSFEKIAPELHIVPTGWKRLAYQVRAVFPTMKGRHAEAFLKGIQSHPSIIA
jgi:GT2 family glycosyltransferase